MSETRLPDELLARLAQLTSDEAQAELEARNLLDTKIAAELTRVALANAVVAVLAGITSFWPTLSESLVRLLACLIAETLLCCVFAIFQSESPACTV